MALKKNKTQGNYVIVSQEIMRDKKLGITERGLLVTLLSFGDNWELSISGLQKILPDGREKINNALNKLIERGYITKYQERSGGKFGKNKYEINEIPVKKKNINGDLAITEKTNTVLPLTGKPQQVTNKESNNKQVINKESSTEKLPDEDYELLVNEFGKDLVDQQIKKIEDRHYKGCMNYSTIKKWCSERKAYASTMSISKANQFNSFPQNTYDFEELEKRLVVNA